MATIAGSEDEAGRDRPESTEYHRAVSASAPVPDRRGVWLVLKPPQTGDAADQVLQMKAVPSQQGVGDKGREGRADGGAALHDPREQVLPASCGAGRTGR
ncbi:hypothetical protein [Streptomyces sp. NPDC056669]|uniref:hypothetical protein n=1 Tax=Streptomyces sp. NPDC056669 TaxID=3345903 RepID=UPI0036913F74